MPLLSRKVDYALLILWHLHHNSQGACSRAIAEKHQLSRGFVANILKELCQGGFVRSERGTKGGYFLAKPADSIALTDVMAALDDPFLLAECCQEAPTEACNIFGTCPIKGPIQGIHQRLRGILASVTLDQLVNQQANTEMPISIGTLKCNKEVTEG